MRKTLSPFASRLSLLAAALVISLGAQAQRAQIDFERAKVQPFPIAVPDAQGGGEAGKLIVEVLRADFDRSGLFKVLDPKSFLADAAKEGLDEKAIDGKPWIAVGAQGLLKISAVADGEGVKVVYRLFDPLRAALVASGAPSGPPDGLRRVAHRIADDVVRFYTQEPGDFATRIAYVRQGAEGKQIVVADSDGQGATAVTGAGINLLPAFAPDGKTVAITSFRDGRGAHIYSVDLSSGAISPLVLMGDLAAGAAFAPDGLRFAYSASVKDNTDLYLAQSDGAAGHRLTNDRGIDISASFSPDGKRIAFVSDRGGSPQIYVMSVDGTGARRLTFEGLYNQEPAWSPKGDVIAFCGRDERNVFDVFTIDVATGKTKRLTDSKGNSDRPAWSPTGRHLLFASSRTGTRQIWMMTADGENQRQITREKTAASEPTWGPLEGQRR